MTKVVMIGAGAMGEAIAAGMLRSSWSPTDLVLVDTREERAAELRARYGVDVVDEAGPAVREAATVLLVVKPYDVDGVLAQIAPAVDADTLVVSLAAGITIAQLEGGLPDGVPVARVMPNTPALVGKGAAAVSPGTYCDDDGLAVVDDILGAVGTVVHVPESQQDAVTAISGSGPAYVFLAIESLIEAGVNLGLPRPTATELVQATFLGAATLATESGEHPTLLRERVTSPGGTTAAGLRALEDHGLRAAFQAAAEAARDRSRELGT